MTLPVGGISAYLELQGVTEFEAGNIAASQSLDLTGAAATKMGLSVDAAGSVASASSDKLRAAQLRSTAAQERYNAVVSDAKTAAANLSKAQVELSDAQASGIASTTALGAAQERVAAAQAQSTALTGKLASTEASLISANLRVAASQDTVTASMAETAAVSDSRLAGSFTNAAKATAGLGGGLLNLVRTIVPVQNGYVLAAAAIAAVGAVSLHAAEDFQDSTKRIQTQAGASATEVKNLSSGMLGLAASVATTPTVLADAAYHIESVGLRGAAALDVLKIAAEGAKIGGADLTDVTNGLDAAVVSGIKGVQNYQQAMGNLNATVGAGDMTMQDLSDALGTGILAAAKTAGLALTDVDAALATFGDNNIRGSEAATKLRQVIMLMEAPSGKAADALKQIGLQSTTLADDMRKPNGLLVAFQDLQVHLAASGKTASEQAAIISAAFGGSRTAGSVEILLTQIDRLQSKYAEVDAGSKNFTKDWAAYTQTFSYAADAMKAGAEALGIELGDKLLPAATSATHWIGTTGVSDVQAFTRGIGELVSMVGPVGPALSSIEGDIGNLLHILEPLGVAIAGVSFGTLAAGFTAAGDILRVTASLLDDVTHAADDAKPEIVGLATAFLALKIAPTVALIPSMLKEIGLTAQWAGGALKTNMAAGLTALTSPAGIAFAGIAVLTAGFIENRAESQRNAAALKAWEATLVTAINPAQYTSVMQITEAFNANRAALDANKTSAAALKAQYGITIAGGTLAAGANNSLTKSITDQTTQQKALIGTITGVGSAMHLSSDEVLAFANKYGIDLTQGVGNATAAFKSAADQQTTTGVSAKALEQAEADMGLSMESATTQATNLKTALEGLNGNQVSALDSQVAFDSSLAQLKANLALTKAGTVDLAAGLNLSTAAGRQSASVFTDLAQKAETSAIAQVQAGADAGATVAQYNGQYAALIASGHAAGYTTTQMQTLLTQYHLTPAQVDTDINANVASASAGIAGVQRGLNNIQKPWFAVVDAVTTGASQKLTNLTNQLDGVPNGAAEVGAQIDNGLIAGMQSRAGVLYATAGNIAASTIVAMNHKLGINSPSKVTTQMGVYMGEGLAIGLSQTQAQVSAAALSLALAATTPIASSLISSAVAPAPNVLQSAASLVPLMQTAGSTQATADAANNQYTQLTARAATLTAQLAAMQAADTKAESAAKAHAVALSNEAYSAEHAGKAAKGNAAALETESRMASQNATALTAANIAKEKSLSATLTATKAAATSAKTAYDTASTAAQTAASAATDAAKSMVASLQTQADAMQSTVTSFESSLSGGISGQPSLTSLWQSLSQSIDGTALTPSVSGLQTNLDAILASTQTFSTDLTSLVGAGANQDLITQITAMGSTAGDALAQQLLAAGPSAITSLQTTMASIDSVAGDEADKLAASFYGPGASAMDQFIEGMEAEFPALQGALQPIIDEINSAFGAGASTLPTSSTTVSSWAQTLGGRRLPHFASGVHNFSGGLAVIDEQGGETVDLPKGSNVYPAGSMAGSTAVLERLKSIERHLANLPSGIGDATTVSFAAAQRAQSQAVKRRDRKR